tara:strand:- start:973 stop:1284 length:312 start_codon:yes stop_codon:yes gene_type:complete
MSFNESSKIKKMNLEIIKDLVKYYNFEDTTYHNDLCRSVGFNLDKNWDEWFKLFLTNSNNNNYDNEEFNTYNVYCEFFPNDDCFDFKNLEDAISFIISNKYYK